jgi:uncharacterized protein (DUF736 family)
VDGYQIADYLDQHGRRTRQDQLGPASLWDALATHAATSSDLTRLGQAARNRGLYRHAAALWTTATARGSMEAATQLIIHLHEVSPADTPRGAQWAASHVSLDDPLAVAGLLAALWEAGDSDAARTLADRAASHASLDTPGIVARVLVSLRWTGDSDAARTLANRAASHASLDNPGVVTGLLAALREAGDSDAARTLADRAARTASLDDPWAVAGLLAELREAGDGDATQTMLARDPAGHVSLDDPEAVARLLAELRKAGHGDAAQTLATRAANAGMFDRFFAPRPNEAVNYRFGRQPGGPNRNPGNGSNPPVEGLPAEIINWRPPYPACREPNVLLHDHRRAPGPGGRRPGTAGKDVAKSAFLQSGRDRLFRSPGV